MERVFAENTGHIDHLVAFFEKSLLTKVAKREEFLDIGPGPATTTARLSNFFTSTTVVEPNRAFASIYEKKGYINHTGNFQDIALDSKYDVVLCSHVLYHVPRAQWVPFLEKLNGSICLGGKGLVLMVAPKGKWHELRSSLNPDYANSDGVERALKELHISYELVPVQSVFKVQNYEDFRALVRLFTLDDCYLPEEYFALSARDREEIEQKIDEYVVTCRQSDGSYEFYDEDVYITMHHEN